MSPQKYILLSIFGLLFMFVLLSSAVSGTERNFSVIPMVLNRFEKFNVSKPNILFCDTMLDSALYQPFQLSIPPIELEPDISLMATNFYGPVELWWENNDKKNEKYLISRKIENGQWEVIGEVIPEKYQSVPELLHYEDLCYATPGNIIYYQLLGQSGKENQSTQIMQICYAPFSSNSTFQAATFDPGNLKINLSFQLAYSGDVVIDLFNQDATWQKRLIQRTLNSGNYSLLLQFVEQDLLNQVKNGYCRLKFISRQEAHSFIQIKELRNIKLAEISD